MDEYQLAKICRRHKFINKRFYGVVCKDEIPLIIPAQKFLIVNTAKRSEIGKHWVVIYTTSDSDLEYFDSYGERPPEDMGLEWLYDVRTNTKRLQSTYTSVCGQYCLYFIYKRSCGLSMENIVSNKFSADNFLGNDSKVCRFVYDIFGLKTYNMYYSRGV